MKKRKPKVSAKEKRFNEALEGLLSAGQSLSNVCFNLSQKLPEAPIQKDWLVSMRAAWKAWDKAADSLRQARGRS